MLMDQVTSWVTSMVVPLTTPVAVNCLSPTSELPGPPVVRTTESVMGATVSDESPLMGGFMNPPPMPPVPVPLLLDRCLVPAQPTFTSARAPADKTTKLRKPAIRLRVCILKKTVLPAHDSCHDQMVRTGSGRRAGHGRRGLQQRAQIQGRRRGAG